jgi:two-component system OmpR family response regulator
MDTGGETRVAVIIEDDDDIRHLLDTVLTQAGFQVIATSNGQDGIDAVRRYEPVVTTLDVNMPGMDGFEAARRIRAFSSTYIVMLTALSEEIDTLQGLDAGADDYINKPFRPRELRARIEAMLRRPRMVGDSAPATAPTVPTAPAAPVAAPAPVYAPAAESGVPQQTEHAPAPPVAPAPSTDVEPFNPAASPTGAGWMEHNDLWLNIETRVVRVGPKEIDLTRSEFDLLAALMESTRRVRTKADLALLLRGESYVTSHFIGEADKRAIEVHMGNLRKKLSDSIASPRWIETVRGVGYRLTAVEGD